MKRKLSIVGLIAALVTACLMGGMAASQFGATAGTVTAIAAFSLMFFKPWLPSRGFRISNLKDVSYSAVEAEVWQDHIEGNLFDDNQFLLQSVDASRFVLQGKVVHIPQAGSTPDVVVNRSVFPATVTERTDTDVTYQLDSFTSDPIKVRGIDKFQLSYDKRASVIGEAEAILHEKVAQKIIIIWAPSNAGNIIRTTGAAVDTHVTGTTGQRLKFLPKDLKKAGTTMDKAKVSKKDRNCVMSADMYEQFTDGLTDTQAINMANTYDPKTGVVGKLYGFTIYTRAGWLLYNSAASTPNAYAAAVAAGDNDAVLCWQKNALERAVGDVIFYNDPEDPTEYGEVSSFEVLAGGRKRRNDQAGVVAIVQGDAGI